VHVSRYTPLPYYSLYSDVIREDLGTNALKEAQKLLDTQVKQIKDIGGSVAQGHLRTGRLDEEIVATAEEAGVGLIVMGSRGLGGVKRALMGSVSDSVVRHAQCPVVVVRKEEPAAGPHAEVRFI